ncbi:MAG TPA: GNAT family N-acetyltransferase [Hyphomicrobiaceae bacterium]|jgi:acetyltransferase|nr:GNAT family N-acetyltransferase [Hyphomicrobiaceae bacterium]
MTYQMDRFAAELIDVVALGGQRVVIRPLLPQDAELTKAFFGSLSPAARYQRFLSPMRSLPPGLVKRLTEVDDSEHVALLAEVFCGDRETLIAEARYARLADRMSAEFAIAVAERWQGQGLASLLLHKLICRAAAAGISHLVGETLASNERMIALARRAGFSVRRSLDVSGLLLLQKTLEPWRPQLPGTAAAMAVAA